MNQRLGIVRTVQLHGVGGPAPPSIVIVCNEPRRAPLAGSITKRSLPSPPWIVREVSEANGKLTLGESGCNSSFEELVDVQQPRLGLISFEDKHIVAGRSCDVDLRIDVQSDEIGLRDDPRPAAVGAGDQYIVDPSVMLQ